MSSSQDYGRPSTDQASESRPLLGESDDEPRSSQPWYRRASASLAHALRPLSEPEKLGPTERLLTGLALVLLLLAAVFIGLFAGAQARLNDGHHDNGRPPVTNPGHGDGSEATCNTAECVLTSALVLKSLDPSVKPCDDFYQFAVGGWLNDLDHQIPGDAGLFGSGQLVAARNAQIIRDLLTKDSRGEPRLLDESDQQQADHRNLGKLRDYYQTCLDTPAQNTHGSKPMLELIQSMRELFHGKNKASLQQYHEQAPPLFVAQDQHRTGPLSRPSDAPKPLPPSKSPGRSPQPHPPSHSPGPPPPRQGRQAVFTSVLSWAHSRGIPAFFDVTVLGDPIKDPTEGTLYVGPGGLSLPDKAYFKDKDENKFLEVVVLQALIALDREESGGSKAELSRQHKLSSLAKRIVALERAIARATPDGDILADPVATYNPVSVNKLDGLFEAVSWPDYLSALTVRVPSKVIVTSPSFLRALNEIISRTEDEVIEGYLMWTIMRTFGLDLGPRAALRAPADALDRRAKGVDSDASEDRNSVCLASLNSALGIMAGRYYVQQALPPVARDRVYDIISSIVLAFKRRLPELDWLDAKTRKAAEIKADNMPIKVGWPDSPNTTDALAVERYYQQLEIKRGGDHFGNQLRASQVLKQKTLAQAGRKLDTLSWDMFAAEVNAEYDPGSNSLTFPAGILQSPYFSHTWPDYLQHGALGAVVGHEVSHGFDPTGRLYDERGFLKDWWSPEVAEEFQKRQTCLEEQYGNYTLDDGTGKLLPLNPKLTIGEDIADAGGVSQSFSAWKHSLVKGSDEIAARNRLLPGLGEYSREQLFFIAYAIAYARNLRPQEALKRIRTDPHSPNRYRVLGVVTNFEPFYEAFGCKKGDPVWTDKKDRCEIW